MIDPLDVLHDDTGETPAAQLLQPYGRELCLPRGTPALVANFVVTTDGIVSFGRGSGQGAMAVSRRSVADRYVMALLRSLCDAVLIGASTLRDDVAHQWTPASLWPKHAEALRELRREATGSQSWAPLVILTVGGGLPAGHPALARPATEVLVLAGSTADLDGLPDGVRVIRSDEERWDVGKALSTLHEELGAQSVLSEAGPHTFGALLGARLVDELFLTVAAQLAGRSDGGEHMGLLDGNDFSPQTAPQLRLRSARRHDSDLLLRYAVER